MGDLEGLDVTIVSLSSRSSWFSLTQNTELKTSLLVPLVALESGIRDRRRRVHESCGLGYPCQ